MRFRLASLAVVALIATLPLANAQDGGMNLPKTIEAGSAFSIPSTGSGNAVLYIVGPSQVLKRDVQLGEAAYFPAGSLYNAGHYLALLVAGSAKNSGWFNVAPATKPANLSFLAKPSRLSIGLHNGISGTLYIFDVYHNLITKPTPVLFKLSIPAVAVQQRTVTSNQGEATTEMDSGTKEGFAKFEAASGRCFQHANRRTGSRQSMRVDDERPSSRESDRVADQSGEGLQWERGA